MITPLQKDIYLNRNGLVCPFCGSANIVGGDIDYGNSQMWQNVVCEKCKKEWTDIYTLTDIEEHTE